MIFPPVKSATHPIKFKAFEVRRRGAVAMSEHAQETIRREADLIGRVAAGTFSERLFYRLNIIHLVAGAGAPEVTLA